MKYHNPNTRGSSNRGYESISPKLGEKIWDQILVHDDGTLGFGGTRTLCVGGQGSGKTTLNTKFATKTYYLDNINKNEFNNSFDPTHPEEWISSYGSNLHPETILWRGRIYDSWNVLVPHIFHNCYPDESFIKPLRVHVHRGDNLKFFEKNAKTGKFHPIKYLDISYYKDRAELYNDILEGGNNIIYPPVNYSLSADLINSINVKKNKGPDDEGYIDPERKKPPGISDIFIFDLIKYIFDMSLVNSRRKWYTVIIDESHDLFTDKAADIYFWIIAWFVDIIIDTRRWNLSLVCQAHDTTLLDWRILRRFSHFIWLPGSRPPNYSQVDGRVVRGIPLGKGIIESVSNGIIGRFDFDRIPRNVSHLVVLNEDQNYNQEQQYLNSCDVEKESVAITDGSVE